MQPSESNEDGSSLDYTLLMEFPWFKIIPTEISMLNQAFDPEIQKAGLIQSVGLEAL